MIAVVKNAPRPGFEVTEVPMPESVPSEGLLLQVEACGVCGTDLSFIDWAPHLRSEIELPRVLGHEIVGTILLTGSAVIGFEIGERVAVETDVACGRCAACKMGFVNQCKTQLRLGQQIDGGFASRVVVSAYSAVRIPQEIASPEATLIQTLGVGLHAIERAGGLVPGDPVLVVGAGPVALLTAWAASQAGASVGIVGLSRDTKRLEFAAGFGATPLNEATLESWVVLQTGGNGVAVAIEAAGSAVAVNSAIQWVRPGGTVVVAGIPEPGEVDLTTITRRELRLVGSWRRLPSTWDRAIALAARDSSVLTRLVEMTVPVSDFGDAFSALKESRILKAVVVPEQS